MKQRILVINPNSNESVTRGIDAALDDYRRRHNIEIDCITLEEGPFGIESDEDIRTVAPMVTTCIASHTAYDAYVIACYSDPGLNESRTIAKRPVLGIQESAVSLSASHSRRFGVVALGRESIQRHIAYVRSLGLQDWHAGERPLDISVDAAANDPTVRSQIVETGRQLIDEDAAETVILGCAGLASHRKPVQQALGVPVIDPVQAAVSLAADSLAQ